MQRFLFIWFLLACLLPRSLWAAFPGLHYFGDLGVLSSASSSIQFGNIHANWIGDHFRFEGRDDDGKSWKVDLEATGGLGDVGVWQADFDSNSRQDLLIAQYSPRSGRGCNLPVILSFLLFNMRGQPVPWVVQTQAPSFDAPTIFADLNHNGRAEVVVTDCEYTYVPFEGTDAHITGIYEAKDATWGIERPARQDAYAALVRKNHTFGRENRFVATDASDWPDQGNRIVLASPAVELTGLMHASENCRGVRFPPIVNGRIMDRSQWKDPCDELGKDRMELSDGTICYGWPTVIVDDAEGREIVAESQHPERLLQRIIEQGRKVVLVGQRDPKRCSPVLVWAARPQ